MDDIINWLERNQSPCIYKKYFGTECPGCGMQRSIIELLKGNIWESILLYPALIPTIILLFYLGLHVFFKFRNGAIVLKYMFFVTLALIMGNYIYKMIVY